MFSDQIGFPMVPMASVSNQPILGDVFAATSIGSAMQQCMQQESKKPCKPKRPLSAYNLFFKHEREKLLASKPVSSEGKPEGSKGKIGFAPLARIIAEKWKNIDDESRDYFEDLAAEDKARYKREKAEWKKAETGEKTAPKATPPNKKKNKLSSILQGVLEDTLQDFGSQDFNLTKVASHCAPQSINSQVSAKDLKPTDLISNHSFPLLGANHLTLQKQDKGQLPFAANFANSILDEKALVKQTQGQNNGSFSLLNVASQIQFGDNIFMHRMNPTLMGLSASQKNNAPDISELAAKLDDECLDILCGR